MAEPSPETFQRRLAAILAADVVGYSRMMEANEAATLRQLRAVRSRCIDPVVSTYGGKLIKSTGDGFLFEFASALDAIYFAIAFQKSLRAEMTPVPEAERLVFRIGIHAGDILSSGADVFGNGVNIAARLETLCTPGGICMSDVVQQQLHGKIELPTVDRGTHQVKNITRAVHVFEIEADAIEATGPISRDGMSAVRRRRPLLVAGVALLVFLGVAGGVAVYRARVAPQATATGSETKDAPKRFSIAILPFTTMGGDGKQDAFADALVDNLTTDLSITLPSSSVISSASTFTYRGKPVAPQQAGRELGAKYLLTGSVQKTSERMRVNVHLIESETGGQLWSDQFDISLGEVSALQDQITIGIANTLSLQLVRAEGERNKYSTNATSLDLTFRAFAAGTHDVTPDSSKTAEADLRQAIVLDPNNLLALQGLSNILMLRAAQNVSNYDDKTSREFAEAQSLLARVRAKNPRFPGLQNALGFVALLQDKSEEAIEHYRTETQNDPSASSAYAYQGICLVKLGRAQEAIPLIEKSIRLDPRGPGLHGAYAALFIAYLALGKYPEAIEQAKHAYNTNPNDPDILFYLAASNALQGNDAEAKSWMAEARKLDPKRTLGEMRRNVVAKNPANIALANRFIDGLRRAGLPD